MSARIRKGDKVVVITGRDKGRAGRSWKCGRRRTAPSCVESMS